jgi:hypothetical protein
MLFNLQTLVDYKVELATVNFLKWRSMAKFFGIEDFRHLPVIILSLQKNTIYL